MGERKRAWKTTPVNTPERYAAAQDCILTREALLKSFCKLLDCLVSMCLLTPSCNMYNVSSLYRRPTVLSAFWCGVLFVPSSSSFVVPSPLDVSFYTVGRELDKNPPGCRFFPKFTLNWCELIKRDHLLWGKEAAERRFQECRFWGYIQSPPLSCVVSFLVKNLPAMQTWLRSLSQEDLLEEGVASHSSISAWEIPRTEEPGGPQSVGWQRVSTADHAGTHTHTHFLSLSLSFSNWTMRVVMWSTPERGCEDEWASVWKVLRTWECMAGTSTHKNGYLGLNLRFLPQVSQVTIPWGIPFLPICLQMGKDRCIGLEKQ